MKIEVGMKCKQTKEIEKFAFNFVGMEFEIIKVDDDVIMGEGNNIRFGIEPNEFENYFELIREEVKEDIKEKIKENINYKGKKIKIINLKGFEEYKNRYNYLEKYINQTGVIKSDWKNGYRFVIEYDNDEEMNIIDKNNGGLCFRIDNVEFIHEDQIAEQIEQIKSKSINKVYTYEMIPHKINWKITHNGEIIDQVIDSGNESYKLITNGNTTIIILDDGCKGIAKCLPSDEYDLDRGVDIAYTEAMIKSYQKKLKGLVK